MFYSSDRAVRELWFEKARSKRTWQISVSYDPRDMENIYVWDNDDKAYDICWLLDWNGKNAGKCLDEIIYEQRKEKIVAKQLKTSEIEAKVSLNAEIDAIVAEATGMSIELPQKSKRARVANISENRRSERESRLQKNKQAADNESMPTGIHQAHRLEEDSDPILRMIRGKVEERMKK
jgi:hypothetical protein